MAGGMQGGYPSPAPTRKQGNNGILLWSLIGCGVIALLLVIIGGVMTTRFMNKAGTKSMIDVMGQMEPTAKNVQKVEAALEEYQKDHKGQSPSTLNALVPKYVSDKSEFVCGSSDNPRPMEYSVPKSDVADSVVVRVHVGDLSLIPTQVQKMYVCLLKNGEIVSEQYARTVMPKYSKGTAERSRSY